MTGGTGRRTGEDILRGGNRRSPGSGTGRELRGAGEGGRGGRHTTGRHTFDSPSTPGSGTPPTLSD